MPKCDLIRREVDFLGHRVGAEGLDQEKAKTEAIVSWTVPTTKKELQRFLGLAEYYRKFIENYAHVAAPLTKLTGTSMAFEWTTEQQTAFDELKRLLVAAPVLALPDVSKPFVIHTDASVYAVGAALQQDQGRGLQPVAFMSVTFTESQRRWPTHEQEMFAVVEGCRHRRHLISGRTVTARSDHNSLQHFFTQRTLSPRQVRWMEELAEYDIEIEYVKGKQNVVADALSRKDKKEGMWVQRSRRWDGWWRPMPSGGADRSERSKKRRRTWSAADARRRRCWIRRTTSRRRTQREWCGCRRSSAQRRRRRASGAKRR